MTYKEFLKLKYFDDFKSQQILTNYDLYKKYYQLNVDNILDNKPIYHLSPIYNSLLKANNFRFIEIIFDNDSCLVCFKIIQIFSLNEIRVFDIKSLNNNFDNIDLIILHLKTLSTVKLVLNECLFNNCKNLNKDEECVEYNDYFIDFRKHNFNSKFRSKNRINILNSCSDFRIELTDKLDYVDFNELLTKWIRYKSVNQKAYTKQINNLISMRSQYKKYITIYYKDKLISVQIFLIYPLYADCLYIIHLGRDAKEYDDILRKVLSNINNIQIYFAYRYLIELNINYLFLAGCRPTEKKLLKHKSRECDDCIRYFIDHNSNVFTGRKETNIIKNDKNKKLF